MFKKVDNVKEYADSLLQQKAVSGLYAKFSRIEARQGKVGQKVVTIMDDGLTETENVITLDEKTNQPGWVVRNIASNEKWIIEDSVFQRRYEIDETYGEKIYKPVGAPVLAIQIPEDITFLAPWGSEMNIKEGGFLIVNSPTDIYGIQEKEFHQTYASCDKNGVFFDNKLNPQPKAKVKTTKRTGKK